MQKWAYNRDGETSCECGEDQTMQHLLVCPPYTRAIHCQRPGDLQLQSQTLRSAPDRTCVVTRGRRRLCCRLQYNAVGMDSGGQNGAICAWAHRSKLLPASLTPYYIHEWGNPHWTTVRSFSTAGVHSVCALTSGEILLKYPHQGWSESGKLW